MPKARRTDPDTSHQAAASISNITETQRAIYYLLLAKPTSDVDGLRVYRLAETHAIAPRVSESGYRSRRAELVSLGLAKDSGNRVKLPSGRFAIVWEAIPPKTSLSRLLF